MVFDVAPADAYSRWSLMLLFLTHPPTHIAEGFDGQGGWFWRRRPFFLAFFG